MTSDTPSQNHVIVEKIRSRNRIVTSVIAAAGVIISAVLGVLGIWIGRNDANPEKYIAIEAYEDLQVSYGVLEDKYNTLNASVSANRQESGDAQSRYEELELKYNKLLEENRDLQETVDKLSIPSVSIDVEDPSANPESDSSGEPLPTPEGIAQALSKLKVSSSYNYSQVSDKEIEDTVGNRYRSGNLFTIHGTSSKDYGHADYYLNSSYSRLTGTIAVSDQSFDGGLRGSLEFLVDDEVVHVIDDIGRTSSPTALDIQLPEGKWMKIRYHNVNGAYSFHYQYIILSDLYLYADE